MSFLRRRLTGGKRDPVEAVLTSCLGDCPFTAEFVPILGLGRNYEVVTPDRKLYLTVLPYGETCDRRIAEIQSRIGDSGTTPTIIAVKDREPLFDGKPYILADQPLWHPQPIDDSPLA